MRGFKVASAVAIAGALAVSSAASPTRADSMQGTRFDAVEARHDLAIKVDRGFARMVVQRTVKNPGDRSDQAMWMLDIPANAVAVGLRTAGVSASGARVWFDGELMEAQAAAAKYKELTGIGGYYPKDPALLSWRSSSLLALQVFPVPPRGEKLVEYTLIASTEYDHGAHSIKLPAAAPGQLPAKVTVTAAQPDDELLVNGVPTTAATRLVLDKDLLIEVKPKRAPVLDGALGAVTVANDRAVTHVRFNAAPHVSRVPDHAAIAIVVDASRSMERELPVALATARAYVTHFPDAEVDVLTFDREVHRLTPRPVSPAEALVVLKKVSLTAANGSHLEQAVASADALLMQRSAKERRMLVISDMLMRDALTPALFSARSYASRAIVHLATIERGTPSLARDDDDAWAAAVTKTGGVFWHASAEETVDRSTIATMEELARPVRIDELKVQGVELRDAPPLTLPEGEGFDSWNIAAKSPASFVVEGKLWSRPFSTRIERTDAEVKRAAALAFTSPIESELSEPEMMVLALKGRAVSPVTSYLAIEPGVRPSTDGLEELGTGTGAGGSGHGIGLGHVRHGRVGPAFDAAGWLAKEIGHAASRCGIKREVDARLETTKDEIVDIGAVEITGQRDSAEETCLREAVWKVMLPSGFDSAHAIWNVHAKPS